MRTSTTPPIELIPAGDPSWIGAPPGPGSTPAPGPALEPPGDRGIGGSGGSGATSGGSGATIVGPTGRPRSGSKTADPPARTSSAGPHCSGGSGRTTPANDGLAPGRVGRADGARGPPTASSV